MDGVRTFLESSTIHGLAYISSTKKWSRLFWVLVVLLGFIGAASLIYESFHSWTESPIKTTIETLPISQLNFPVVTVCPPKNTYTDINYDLLAAEKVDKNARENFVEYGYQVIDDHLFLDRWRHIIEEHQYYNWYHGYTKLKAPYFHPWAGLIHELDTTATSGTVSTQFFGELFNINLVPSQKFDFSVDVHVPYEKDDSKYENATVLFELEMVSLIGIEKGQQRYSSRLFGDLNSSVTNVKGIFTIPKIELKKYNIMSLQMRNPITKETLETLNGRNKLMPGFKIHWNFTSGYEQPDRKFYSDGNKMTREFIK